MSQLILSGRLLRLKLFQVGTEDTCTMSMAISNESSCHKEFKVVNIIPVPGQDKKAKSWEPGAFFCLVLVGFFQYTRHSRERINSEKSEFHISVIYFIVFLLTKMLEFEITELEHQTEVHSDVTTLFARLDQDMLANKNMYVPKNPLGGIHLNCCC